MLSRRDLLLLAGATAGSSLWPSLSLASKAEPLGESTLFFEPRHLTLWDTWVYFHGGKYYLYYLCAPMNKTRKAPAGKADGVGLAISKDGVHWEDRGRVLDVSKKTFCGSGAVWPALGPAGSQTRFIMNYSEWRGSEKSGRQTIFFAESHDLEHWTPLGTGSEFKQDTRWYERDGRWDNIWVVSRTGGGYFGYWAANPKDKKPGIGLGESLDGVKWNSLPPPVLIDVPVSPEISAIREWKGKYYALVSPPKAPVDLGNDTLIADSPFGPFRPSRKNRRLLAAHSSYFTRFIDTPDGLLVNHHSWVADARPEYHPKRAQMAPLKRAVWDEEGTLRLKWWEGNEKAKRTQVPIELSRGVTDKTPALLSAAFGKEDALVLEGMMSLPESPTIARGLYLQGSGNQGTAILVRPNGSVDYGSIQADGTQFEQKGSVDRELSFSDSVRFRLLRKGRLTEFYLDDFLMQCYCLPDIGTGRLGVIGWMDSFQKMNAWYCR